MPPIYQPLTSMPQPPPQTTKAVDVEYGQLTKSDWAAIRRDPERYGFKSSDLPDDVDVEQCIALAASSRTDDGSRRLCAFLVATLEPMQRARRQQVRARGCFGVWSDGGCVMCNMHAGSTREPGSVEPEVVRGGVMLERMQHTQGEQVRAGVCGIRGSVSRGGVALAGGRRFASVHVESEWLKNVCWAEGQRVCRQLRPLPGNCCCVSLL